MLDLRKINLWYSDNITNLDQYKSQKIENIFTKSKKASIEPKS